MPGAKEFLRNVPAVAEERERLANIHHTGIRPHVHGHASTVGDEAHPSIMPGINHAKKMETDTPGKALVEGSVGGGDASGRLFGYTCIIC